MSKTEQIEFVLVAYGMVDMQGNRYSKKAALSIAEQSKGRIIPGEDINPMMSIQHISGAYRYKIIDTKLDEDNAEQGRIIAIAEKQEEQ